ncbi:MAG: AAA family ATPase [Patescibacteria group bacterium]|nr:AAA family ATPase [Patescibacteria group bacterium]
MACQLEKIYGHQRILNKLISDADNDNISGAYLFVGPSKIGKFTVAKILAKQLQCEGKNCRACLQIRKNIHPDTLVIDDLYVQDQHEDLDRIASHTNLDQQYRVKKGIKTDSIGVDDVRQIIAVMSQKKLANYKIALINKVERLNNQATNALLKFVEELPEKTVVIMTTTDEERLLPTLVSRLKILRFHNLGEDEHRLALSEIFPDKAEEQIKQAIWLSQGRIGRSIDFLKSEQLFQKYVEQYRQIESLFEQSSLARRFDFIKDVVDDSGGVTRFLRIFTYFVRRLLQAKLAGDHDNIATNFSLSQLLNLARTTDTARMRIKGNAKEKLQLENLMLEF